MSKKEQFDYVIPLKPAMKAIRTLRANAAVREIRRFLAKHRRGKETTITQEVNELLWERGKFKIPSKLEVTVKDFNGKSRVYLKGSKLIEEEAKKKTEEEKKKKESEKQKEKDKEEKEKNEELQKKKQEKKLKEDAADLSEIRKG